MHGVNHLPLGASFSLGLSFSDGVYHLEFRLILKSYKETRLEILCSLGEPE
jgi:hypothetical protein